METIAPAVRNIKAYAIEEGNVPAIPFTKYLILLHIYLLPIAGPIELPRILRTTVIPSDMPLNCFGVELHRNIKYANLRQ